MYDIIYNIDSHLNAKNYFYLDGDNAYGNNSCNELIRTYANINFNINNIEKFNLTSQFGHSIYELTENLPMLRYLQNILGIKIIYETDSLNNKVVGFTTTEAGLENLQKKILAEMQELIGKKIDCPNKFVMLKNFMFLPPIYYEGKLLSFCDFMNYYIHPNIKYYIFGLTDYTY